MNKPTLPNEERRAIKIELRMDGMDTDSPMMRGHAAVFNSMSEIMVAKAGGKQVRFRELIAPGAFDEALKNSDARALFNHDPNMILGRTSAGTLRLQQDDSGLAVEIDPPDTTCGRDLQVSMKRGDIREMSYGFTVADGGDEWRKDPDSPGQFLRTITKIERLYDVSPVTYPAFPETDCSLRSLGAVEEEVEVPDQRWKEENEIRKRRLDIEAVSGGVELRVNLGWCGENTIGVCDACGQDGCLCTDCPNNSCCNMQAGSDSACTKCMKPGCKCLDCPSTDKCKLMKMYQY